MYSNYHGVRLIRNGTPGEEFWQYRVVVDGCGAPLQLFHESFNATLEDGQGYNLWRDILFREKTILRRPETDPRIADKILYQMARKFARTLARNNNLPFTDMTNRSNGNSSRESQQSSPQETQ